MFFGPSVILPALPSVFSGKIWNHPSAIVYSCSSNSRTFLCVHFGVCYYLETTIRFGSLRHLCLTSLISYPWAISFRFGCLFFFRTSLYCHWLVVLSLPLTHKKKETRDVPETDLNWRHLMRVCTLYLTSLFDKKGKEKRPPTWEVREFSVKSVQHLMVHTWPRGTGPRGNEIKRAAAASLCPIFGLKRESVAWCHCLFYLLDVISDGFSLVGCLWELLSHNIHTLRLFSLSLVLNK